MNDNSEIIVDGFKVEGPGELVKSINGGKTRLNLFNAAWWGNKIPDNALFESHDSHMTLIGGNVFCFPDDDHLCLTIRNLKNGIEERTLLKDCSDALTGLDALGRSWGRLIKNVEV